MKLRFRPAHRRNLRTSRIKKVANAAGDGYELAGYRVDVRFSCSQNSRRSPQRTTRRTFRTMGRIRGYFLAIAQEEGEVHKGERAQLSLMPIARESAVRSRRINYEQRIGGGVFYRAVRAMFALRSRFPVNIARTRALHAPTTIKVAEGAAY